jgi:NADH-quinone oxidoreductase subunit B
VALGTCCHWPVITLSHVAVVGERSVDRVYRVVGDPELRVLVLDVGLACCALEVGAAITSGLLVLDDPDSVDPAGTTWLLLISGTVTDALAPAVLRAWESLPQPRRAMSFGACANTGGPYWDAPTVTKGVDQLIEVSVYVPGCPPRPEALIAGLRALAVSEDTGSPVLTESGTQ